MMFISMPNGGVASLATKSSPLPAIALILPDVLRPSAIPVAKVSGALLAPLTTSNSLATLAWCKEMRRPATSCGRLVALAMMSMSMPEVFE